ncbi:hypothetical protein MIR68_007336 [Amoeboaphelidium protococcarum]|nr:hypothetical protein MIR68_007336 [Amoeboaphelidium protococcarum]
MGDNVEAHDPSNSWGNDKPPANDQDGIQAVWDDELQGYVKPDKDDSSFRYLWDASVRAWFPVFNEDHQQQQQSAYTSIDHLQSDTKRSLNEKELNDTGSDYFNDTKTHSVSDKQQTGKKRKQNTKDNKPNQSRNSSVYVSKLPPDVTKDELKLFFNKCGVIMPDLRSSDKNDVKIKIYRQDADDSKDCKGDALVTYFKPESVDLAITILDDTELRPGVTISVQKADFSHKKAKQDVDIGQEQVQAAVSSSLDKKVVKSQMKRVEKKLGW